MDRSFATKMKTSHADLHPLPPRSPPPQYPAKGSGTFRMRPSQPESTSPWTKRTLLILWVIQIAYPLILFIANTSVIVPTLSPGYNSDDRHPFILYLPGLIELCFMVMCLGMSIFQIARYSRNRLMPAGMLIMSCLATMMWLEATIMNLLVFAFSFVNSSGSDWAGDDEPRTWASARTLLVFNSLIIIPSIYQLAYVSIVFARFQRLKKEVQSGVRMQGPEHADRQNEVESNWSQ